MEQNERHFNKTFWYIMLCTVFILCYVVAITFIKIPKENMRFVDIALAFLLGLMSGLSAYLTGGNPQRVKQRSTPTTEINSTIVKTTLKDEQTTE